MEQIEIGTRYSDPEGIFEVTEVSGEWATVKSESGAEYEVPTEEVAYFLSNPASRF